MAARWDGRASSGVNSRERRHPIGGDGEPAEGKNTEGGEEK
jgi:hypothetical protein